MVSKLLYHCQLCAETYTVDRKVSRCQHGWCGSTQGYMVELDLRSVVLRRQNILVTHNHRSHTRTRTVFDAYQTGNWIIDLTGMLQVYWEGTVLLDGQDVSVHGWSYNIFDAPNQWETGVL